MIIDEQRNLQQQQQPAADGGGDHSDRGDQGGGTRGEQQQSSNGQATHRGLIPRARVKVTIVDSYDLLHCPGNCGNLV